MNEFWIEAWENGVPGDGTDQTSALQALIDCLPEKGGTILLKGDILVSELSLLNRRHIRLLGLGSIGTGADAPTVLIVTNSSTSQQAEAINMRGTTACGFENMYIVASDPNFAGSVIRYGIGDHEAYYPYLKNCLVSGKGALVSKVLDLRGSTQGRFDRVSFRGRARHVIGTDAAIATSFSNQQKFVSCSFNPAGQYCVYWPGENWMFDSCNVQAGYDDGVGRFISGTFNARFKNLTLKNVTMYDVLTGAGTIWLAGMYGQNLTVEDCLFGAQVGAYGVQLCGTQGIRIVGNRMKYGNALVMAGLDGSIKAGGGLITSNVFDQQSLIASVSNLNLSNTDVYGNPYQTSGTTFFNRATA